jgi:hypothetical protein
VPIEERLSYIGDIFVKALTRQPTPALSREDVESGFGLLLAGLHQWAEENLKVCGC